MKFYTNQGHRREIKVLSIDLTNSTATIENCDLHTEEIKLKSITLEPEDVQPKITQPETTPSPLKQMLDALLIGIPRTDIVFKNLNIILKEVLKINPKIENLEQLTKFLEPRVKDLNQFSNFLKYNRSLRYNRSGMPNGLDLSQATKQNKPISQNDQTL